MESSLGTLPKVRWEPTRISKIFVRVNILGVIGNESDSLRCQWPTDSKQLMLSQLVAVDSELTLIRWCMLVLAAWIKIWNGVQFKFLLSSFLSGNKKIEIAISLNCEWTNIFLRIHSQMNLLKWSILRIIIETFFFFKYF